VRVEASMGVRQGVRSGLCPARAGRERDTIAVTTLDSSAAWASATRMVAANRDLLMAIAGVFFVLPWLASSVFVPAPVLADSLTEAQKIAQLQAYLASSLPVLIGLSLPTMVGVLTMLVSMLDPTRPTVGQCIRRGLGVFPGYLASQLAIVLVWTIAFGVFAAVAGLMVSDKVALVVVMVALLYFVMRTILVAPVMARQAVRNPLLAIRESIRLTSGNVGRIFSFIGLSGLLFFVVYGLLMMFVSVVLVLLLQGEPQRLLGEGLGCTLLAIGNTYYVAMLAAIYSQLAGPASGSAVGPAFGQPPA
jgi:hypothetical protein